MHGLTNDLYNALFCGLMNRREWLEARLCDADIAGKSIEYLVYIKDELRKVDEAFEYLKFQ